MSYEGPSHCQVQILRDWFLVLCFCLQLLFVFIERRPRESERERNKYRTDWRRLGRLGHSLCLRFAHQTPYLSLLSFLLFSSSVMCWASISFSSRKLQVPHVAIQLFGPPWSPFLSSLSLSLSLFLSFFSFFFFLLISIDLLFLFRSEALNLFLSKSMLCVRTARKLLSGSSQVFFLNLFLKYYFARKYFAWSDLDYFLALGSQLHWTGPANTHAYTHKHTHHTYIHHTTHTQHT